MAMAYIKLTRSQIALSLVASLLTLTPLFSSSIRPTYIYLIFNLLIIALGAEAGLLSSLLSNPNPNYSKDKPKTLDSTAKLDDGNRSSDEIRKMVESRTIERCSSENVNAAMKKTVVQVIKKCASTPSIFFIGGGDCSQVEQQEQDHRHVRLEIRDNDVEQVEDEEEEEDDVVGGQELFAKAEDFIGNFYKQLNMQREDSWKKIHGFYPISSLNQ